jgi:hypothetical protein
VANVLQNTNCKQHWTPLTGDEATAIQSAGKYRTITWERHGNEIFALVDEHLKAWRQKRVTEGNRGES